MLAVLLLSWTELPGNETPYEVLDYFAGKAHLARSARYVGKASAAFDIDYQEGQAMNVNSPAGFAFLGFSYGFELLHRYVAPRMLISGSGLALRLCIVLALQASDYFFASFGTLCSSWVSTAVGGQGNMRSFVAPMGHPENAKILAANLMVSRTELSFCCTLQTLYDIHELRLSLCYTCLNMCLEETP